METNPQQTVLRVTGELRDEDNLGTIPTYTLATWLYSEDAYKRRKWPRSETGPKPIVVLQRMFLDARKGGWTLMPQIQEVSPSDPILKLFKLSEEPLRDAVGYYAVFTSTYPQVWTSGEKDWAVWAGDRPLYQTRAAHPGE
jgi:hypothetical protein